MTKIALKGFSKGDLEEPPRVLLVERLWSDVNALKKLMAPVAPPRVRLRAQDVLLALYLAGDASGVGFGSPLIKDKEILYESGTWTTDWKKESPNFRKADNFVRKIESLVEAGDIQG